MKPSISNPPPTVKSGANSIHTKSTQQQPSPPFSFYYSLPLNTIVIYHSYRIHAIFLFPTTHQRRQRHSRLLKISHRQIHSLRPNSIATNLHKQSLNRPILRLQIKNNADHLLSFTHALYFLQQLPRKNQKLSFLVQLLCKLKYIQLIIKKIPALFMGKENRIRASSNKEEEPAESGPSNLLPSRK